MRKNNEMFLHERRPVEQNITDIIINVISTNIIVECREGKNLKTAKKNVLGGNCVKGEDM